jgi:hypothetical protein
MPPLGDRRAHVRLEVVGALWGSLEWSEPARVLNISTTGLLVESPAPLAPESRQSVSPMADGELIVVDTHVRRFARKIDSDSAAEYLIALEFISPPLQLVHWVEKLSKGTDQIV